MRTLLLAAVLAIGTGSVAGCAKDKTEQTADGLPVMSPDQVEKSLAANEVTAVDCNGESTRKKFGIVPGAVLIADEETFTAGDLPADKARKLVFYCSSTS